MIHQILPFPTTKQKIPIMPGGGLNRPMKLSPELAAIVGKGKASTLEVLKTVRAYIKRKQLMVNWN